MQSFLVSLCIAILEKLLVKGTAEYKKYEELRAELEKNSENAADYDKVVSKPGNTREERKDAEDSALG